MKRLPLPERLLGLALRLPARHADVVEQVGEAFQLGKCPALRMAFAPTAECGPRAE
jgi:hypothetical protein